jgi:CDP-glucose 4,6-dehydratase
MDISFWQNKKVLITGHTGFKGSWLTLWLQSMGANVIGYALPMPNHPNLFNLTNLEKNILSYTADIRDLKTLRHVVKHERPDIVFHLAAQSLVRYSYAHPIETYETNVMGTVYLLEALRKTDCARSIVIITSDKCYDNREWVARGYRETEPMGGDDPYSSSKGCAELITTAYRKSFFTDKNQQSYLASARAGNVIGGGDFATDRLIPDFIRAIMEDRPIKIRNPNAIRPWQHVLEPLSGYLLLAEHLWTNGENFAESWNFGPKDKDTQTVESLVNQLIQLWGDGAQWELDRKKHLHEANYLKLDASKAQSRLKWNPKWRLEIALRHTVDWYKAYQERQDVQTLMLQQINEYEKSHPLQETQ